MTKEEYVEIDNEIKKINFDIYECNRELIGLRRFLEFLQNKNDNRIEHIEAVEVVKKEIAKKENIIRLLEKERAYYQKYAFNKED